MLKKELRQNENPVGAAISRPYFKEIAKNSKGITLIALIITIIIMLILVGVSINVVLNGGLFNTAEQAAEDTQAEKEKELALSEGEVEIEGLVYSSMEDYINNKPKLPEGWVVATDEERATAWPTETVKNENVTAIKEATTNNIVALPKGYQVSLEEGENTVSKGLVITDGVNEFVWIPVETDFEEAYSSETDYLEPVKFEYISSTAGGNALDSQESLDYFYGENYYDFETDFNYTLHYSEMFESVNKYNGFYIGRYETTVETLSDGTSIIGSKENTTVLTTDKILKTGINDGEGLSNKPFSYRWWGLYDAQRNSNVEGNGSIIQTSMVWGQQWDSMLDFLGNTQANSTISGTQSNVLKSGQAIYDNNLKDEMNNIYDLRRNTREYTAQASGTNNRVYIRRLLQI